MTRVIKKLIFIYICMPNSAQKKQQFTSNNITPHQGKKNKELETMQLQILTLTTQVEDMQENLKEYSCLIDVLAATSGINSQSGMR